MAFIVGTRCGRLAQWIRLLAVFAILSAASPAVAQSVTFWRTDFSVDPTTINLNGDSLQDFDIRGSGGNAAGNRFNSGSNGITTDGSRTVWHQLTSGGTSSNGGPFTTLDTAPNDNTTPALGGPAQAVDQVFSSRTIARVTNASVAAHSPIITVGGNGAGTVPGLYYWTYFQQSGPVSLSTGNSAAINFVLSNYGNYQQISWFDPRSANTILDYTDNLPGSDYLRIDSVYSNATSSTGNGTVTWSVYDDSQNDKLLYSHSFVYNVDYGVNNGQANGTLIQNFNPSTAPEFYVDYFDQNLQTYLWNTAANGNWNDTTAAGWNSAAAVAVNYPNAAQNTTVFNQPLAAAAAISITTTDAAVGTLSLNNLNPASAAGWTIASDNGTTHVLTFDNTGPENSGAALLNFGLSGGSALQQNVISAPVVLNSSLNVNVLAGTTATISGAISSGNAGTGLTLVTGGTLVLSAANSYTGPTSIQGGSLRVNTLANGGANSAIGASPNAAANLVINGGTLTYTGGAVNTDRLFTIGSGGATINAAGTGAVNFRNSGAVATSGSGYRTLTLTGASGAGGTLAPAVGDGSGGATSLAVTGPANWTLSGANSYTGGTAVASSTLSLDFTTSNTQKVSNARPLALTSGTLNVLANSAGTASLAGTLGNGTVVNAGASAVQATSTSAATSLALGPLSRSTGGTVDFSLPASGNFTTATPDASFAGGQQTILGGWATVGGSTWAVSGTGATPGNISGLNSYSSTFTAAKDVDAPSGVSAPAAGLTINSLRFNNAGPYTLNDAGGLTIATGGILETANVGASNIIINASSTGLFSGNGQDLTVIQNNTAGTMSISTNIGSGSAFGFTKAGPGTFIETGSNSYSGQTTVNAGILQLGTSNLFKTNTGAIVINNGGQILLSSSNGITDNGTGATVSPVTVNAGGLLQMGAGQTGHLGNLTLNGGTLGSADAGSATFGTWFFDLGLTAGGSLATSTISAQHVALTQTGGTVFTVNSGAANGIDLDLTGNIWAAGGGTTNTALVKAGGGVMRLSGTNAYATSTTINAGTLILDYTTNNTQKISTSAPLSLGGGTLDLVPNATNATFQTVGNGLTLTADTASVIAAAAAPVSGTSFTLGTSLSRGAGSTLDFELPTSFYSGTPNGNIAVTAANNGAGILGGWATFNGTDWAINNGTGVRPLSSYASFAGSGGASTANFLLTGSGSVTASETVNSLKITSNNVSQGLALGANNLTLSGSSGGTGPTGGLLYVGGYNSPYTISGTGTIGAGTANEFIVNTLAGTTLNISAPIIGNGGGSLTKAGGGTLVLSNATADGYTGGTNIIAGTLQLGADNPFNGTGTVTVATGATLDLNGHMLGRNGNLSGTGVGGNGALINSGSPATINSGLWTLNSGASIGGSGDISLSGGSFTMSGQFIKVGADTVQLGITVAPTSVTINGGMLQETNGTVGGTATTVTINASGTWTINNADKAGTLNLNSGAVVLGGNGTSLFGASLNATGVSTISGPSALQFANPTTISLVNPADTLTISSQITNGSITKSGPGTLILNSSGGNTLGGGAVTVNGGTLQVNSTSGNHETGSETITLNNGATLADSAGSGGDISASSVVVNSGGSIAGFSGGTLSALQVTLNANSISRFTLSGTPNGTANPLINSASNALSPNGKNTVNIFGAVQAGTYDLIGNSGTIANFNSLMTLGVTPGGTFTYGLVNTNNQIDLNVVSTIGTLTWTGAAGSGGNAAWDTTTQNWANAAPAAAVYVDGDLLTFNDTSSLSGNPPITNSNITVSAPVSPGLMTFTNNTVNYSIGGSAIGGTGSLIKNGSASLTLSGPNTFSGGANITGGTLRVAANTAVSGGVIASGPVGTGTLTLSAGTTLQDDGSTRTLANNVAVSGNVTFSSTGSGSLVFDPTGLTTPTTFSVSGNPTLTVNNNVTINNLVNNGTTSLTKTGPGTLTLGGSTAFTGNTGTDYTPGIVLNGGTTVIAAGAVVSTPSTPFIDVNIGNGSANTAALNITGGTLTVGDTFRVSDGGSGNANFMNAAVNQSSGTVNVGYYLVLGQGAQFGGATGSGGYGVYNLSGGTVNVKTVGTGALNGSFFQLGGSGNGDSAGGVFNISGTGTLKLWNNSPLQFGANGANAGTSTFNQTGGTVTFFSDGGVTPGGTGSVILGDNQTDPATSAAANSTGAYSYNLNGGTLIAPQVSRNSTATASATTYGIFNFNGGTLKPTVASTTFMQGITAAYVNGAFGSFAGGATIDTNGQSVTIAQPLLAPTSNGVSGITLTGAGTGYFVPPTVAISGGGGSGATAVATITAGQLSIVLTNPGVGYTSAPNVTLSGGGFTSAAGAATASVAANTSGGLAKNGAGTLTLSGTNTYSGITSITAGTLALAAASTNNIANSGSIRVGNGATLDTSGLTSGTLVLGAGATQSLSGPSSGSGAVAGSVRVANGSTIAGSSGAALAISGVLTLQGGSLSSFTLGAPNNTSNPLIATSTGSGSSLAVSGLHTINLAGTPQTGTYDLFSYTGALSGFGNLSLGSQPGGLSYSLSNNTAGSQIDLIVSQAALIWTGQTGGTGATNHNWTTSGGDTNWADPTIAPTSYQDGKNVSFTDANPVAGGTAPDGTVTIQSGGVAPVSVTFTNTGVANGGVDYTLSNASSDTVGIKGATGITMNGIGSVTLLSPNSFTGPVAINAGKINVQNSGALGTSSGVNVASGAGLELQGGVSIGAIPLTIAGTGVVTNSGALNSVSGANSYAGNIMIGSGGGMIASSHAGDTLTLSGTIGTAGNTLFVTGAGNVTISNLISGTGGLSKSGSGTLLLSNSSGNSYGGPTAIGGGLLLVANTVGSSATGTGAVTIGTGGTLGGGGFIGGPVSTVSSGSNPGLNGHISPSAGGTAATLTINNTLGLDINSFLDFQLNTANAAPGSGGNDLVNVTGTSGSNGTLTLSNDLTLNVTPGLNFAAGTYHLITYTGSLFDNSGSFSGWTATGVGSHPYHFAVGSGELDLVVLAGNGSAQWNVNGNGNFSQTPNWSPPQLPSGAGLTATFGNGATVTVNNNVQVLVDGAFTDGTLAFTNTNGAQYTLTSDGNNSHGITLTSGNSSGAAVNVTAGTHSIFANLTLADSGGTTFNIAGGAQLTMGDSSIIGESGGSQGLTKAGDGTLVMLGTNSYTGPTMLNGGTTVISSDKSLGAAGLITINAATLDSEAFSLVSSRNYAVGNAASTINVEAFRTLEITTPVTGTGSLTVTGGNSSSTLILDKANSYAGNTNVNSGYLRLDATSGTATIGASATVTVAAGATLELAGTVSALSSGTTRANVVNNSSANTGGMLLVTGSNQQVGTIDGTGDVQINDGADLTASRIRQNSLTIGESSGPASLVIRQSGPGGGNPVNDTAFSGNLNSLTIANNGAALGTRTYRGTLNINNNGLVIPYGTGPNPLNDINDMVRSGYNNGAFTGQGITSTTAASTPGLNIAVADNAQLGTPYTTFEGQTVSIHSVLVRMTYMDDLTLAGTVSQNDAILFGANYDNGASSNHYWWQGDLNHDGHIDQNDAILFGANYNTALPPLDSSGGGLLQFGAALDGNLSAVPEPSTVVLLALGGLAGLAMLSRRSRRRAG